MIATDDKETNELRCLPAIYLVGIQKSGTSELHQRLVSHHQIYEGKMKEPKWLTGGGFDAEVILNRLNMTRPFNLYGYMKSFENPSGLLLKQLRNKTERQLSQHSLIIDSSQISVKEAVKIHTFNPSAKLIYIMRDPVERTFSDYRFANQVYPSVYPEQTPEGFHKVVSEKLINPKFDIIGTSVYYWNIVKVLEVISKNDILFIKYEDFIADEFDYLEKHILPFLNLSPYKPSAHLREKPKKPANPSYHSYKMLNKTRIILQNMFRPYNAQLDRLLGNTGKWQWGY